MRRIASRILIGLIVLLALLVAAGQAVLWSDLPRRVAVSKLQQRLGLEVTIADLDVGWFGRTTAHDITVSLPLARDAFLELPRLELRHTSLPWLAVGRTLDIQQATALHPTLHIRPLPTFPGAGAEVQWNLQQVWTTLRANLARQPDDPSKGPLKLPALTLRNATIDLTHRDGRATRLTDIGFVSRPRGALSYEAQLNAPHLAQVDAQLALAPPYAHEATFTLTPSPDLVAALTPIAPSSSAYHVQGQWHGEITPNNLQGTLTLAQADLPPAQLQGEARVTLNSASDTLTLEPRRLRITALGPLPEPITLTAGQLRLQHATLTAVDLRFAGLDGQARLDAQLNLATLVGQATAAWNDLTYPHGYTSHGSLTAQLGQRGANRRTLALTLRSTGASPLGAWAGQAQLNAVGEHWTRMAGTLTATDLQLTTPGAAYRVQDLAAQLALDAPELRMTRLRMSSPDPGSAVRGQGTLNWQSGVWSLALQGQSLNLPTLPTPLAELQLTLQGTPEHIQLTAAHVRAAGVEAEARGEYLYARPKPLALRVALTHVPLHVGAAERPVVAAQNVAGELNVQGTVQPLALEAQGDLLAKALHVRDEALGDVVLHVRAAVDREAARLEADAIEWLSGQWALRARYDRTSGATRVFMDATHVDLAQADRLLPTPLGLERGYADLALVAAGLEAGASQARLEGTFALTDFARPPLLAERVQGRMSLAQGRLAVHELEAAQDAGTLVGSASFLLAEPDQIEASAQLTRWPITAAVAHGQVQARVSGAAALNVDLSDRAGQGQATLTTDLTSQNLPLGTLETALTLDGSTLVLDRLVGSLLTGRAAGTGRINLLDPTHSTLALEWDALAPQTLAPLIPALAPMQGTVGGTLRMAPTQDPRALGPVRVDLQLRSSEVVYEKLPIGDAQATLYLDGQRTVLHHLQLAVAGGQANLWGRVSHHDGQQFAYAHGSLTDIDLAVATGVLRPHESPILGLLSGDLTLSMPLDRWDVAFGRGTIALRESDLGNIPLFSLLYDLVNFRLTGRDPAGRGDGHFRIEEGVVFFDRLRYEHRGGHIRMVGRVHDVWAGGDSPISGYAMVSAEPLPDVEFLDVLNEAFAAIQAGLVTVAVDGTIDAPRSHPVLLKGLQDAVGRLFGGGGE